MRQHVATVLGIAPPAPLPGPRRRAADRLVRPRVLVYLEGGRIDVITEGDVVLDADGAAELAGALESASLRARR